MPESYWLCLILLQRAVGGDFTARDVGRAKPEPEKKSEQSLSRLTHPGIFIFEVNRPF
jgi:hypothetical protein